MKKKILILFILCLFSVPVLAVQEKFGGNPTEYSQSDKTTKIYNKHGSYQYKLVQKPNGQTRVYNKTGSFQGYYKKDGSKIKYYPKN